MNRRKARVSITGIYVPHGTITRKTYEQALRDGAYDPVREKAYRLKVMFRMVALCRQKRKP